VHLPDERLDLPLMLAMQLRGAATATFDTVNEPELQEAAAEGRRVRPRVHEGRLRRWC